MPLTYQGQPLTNLSAIYAPAIAGTPDTLPSSDPTSPSAQAPTSVARLYPSDSSSSVKWPILADLLGGAADVATTQVGLAKGGREMNPLLPQGRVANALALAGSYLGNALLAHYLNQHGHHTLASVMGYAGGVDGATFAAHNLGAFKFPGEQP